jgi:hypothetical protein
VQQLGDLDVESDTVLASTLLWKSRSLGHLDHVIAQTLKLVSSDAATPGGSEDSGAVPEVVSTTEVADREPLIVVMELPSRVPEKTWVQDAHGPASKFAVSWIRLLNSAGAVARSRRSASNENAGKALRTTFSNRAPRDPAG